MVVRTNLPLHNKQTNVTEENLGNRKSEVLPSIRSHNLRSTACVTGRKRQRERGVKNVQERTLIPATVDGLTNKHFNEI